MTRLIPTALVLVLSLAACTRAQPPGFRSGDKPLESAFPAKEIEIIRAEPSRGETWTVKLVKNGPEPTDWAISGHSAGVELLDRRAHGTFLEHLMSTLRTLQVTGDAARGPIESYGLLPPAFAIRWNGGELRVGSPGPEAFERFAEFRLDGKIGSTPAIYRVKGSALEMLQHLESFTSVRQAVLVSPLTSDEVDELEVSKTGRNGKFYAQREGDVWTDRRHKPVRKDIDAFLETLTHARIQEFVDDRVAAEEIARKVPKSPLYSITLNDRKGKPTRIDLGWSVAGGEEHLYATVSSRPGAFRVYRELLFPFESLMVR